MRTSFAKKGDGGELIKAREKRTTALYSQARKVEIAPVEKKGGTVLLGTYQGSAAQTRGEMGEGDKLDRSTAL